MRNILIVILLIGVFSACDVLDVKPAASVDAADAITDRAGVEQAVNACYDALQFSGYYGRNLVIAADLTTDNADASGTIKEYGELANNNLLADNLVVEGIWNDIYAAINRVNNVLYYLPGVADLSDAEAADVEGQMRFLRALHHFNLLRLFGPVPLKTQPSLDAGASLNAPRTSLETLFDAIVSDLVFAEANITETRPSRASAGAAMALLAKVYLQSGDFDLAQAKASDVISLTSYSLETSFASLFGGGSNTEEIFFVDFNAQDKNRLAEYFLPTTFGGRKEVSPSADLIASFEEGDVRKSITIGNPEGDGYAIKYLDISTGTDKVYVFRLAEMYLLRAEAELLMNGDLDAVQADINRIRLRAGLGNTEADTKEELTLEIEHQRRVEFAFEGHRWFDLIRTGRAIDLIPSLSLECQMLFPIPLSEIQTNESISPGDQNPCY